MQPLRHDRLRGLAVIGGLLGFLLLPAALGGGGEAAVVRVSVNSAGVEANGESRPPAISGNGRAVAFASEASNLVAGDTNGVDDVFVHDPRTGTTARVSVDSSGAQASGESLDPSISGNGRFVAFASEAADLVPGDTNDEADVFVHDRKTGTTTRVSVDSVGGEANDASDFPSISGNGRFVAFRSDATNLVPGDTNGHFDLFVHDLRTGATTRVSVDSAGAQADSASSDPSVSGNGRFVAFASLATNLVPGDTNGDGDVFLHDRKTGTTSRVSVDSAGGEANDASDFPSISGNGRFVAFRSSASDLVPGDTNGASDVFVRDVKAGATILVSVDSAGVQGNGESIQPSLSAKGRLVAFQSGASNLVPGDTNGTGDVFVHDLKQATTARASVDSTGGQANSPSFDPSISGNGRSLAFKSFASNLVPGDTNGEGDIFVRR